MIFSYFICLNFRPRVYVNHIYVSIIKKEIESQERLEKVFKKGSFRFYFLLTLTVIIYCTKFAYI